MTTETTAELPGTAGDPAAPGRWRALHVYYSSDTRPILTDCVAPLVRRLRERGLIAGYFFINYWMEGSHVRLRLKPATEGDAAEVCALADAAVAEFLARRPALYRTEYDRLEEFYDHMFDMEYSAEERLRMYPDGRMPMQPNNSAAYRPYEPEYAKYGGPVGIELAEWHFEESSDLVLDLLGTMNVHVRPIMLGLSSQVMMVMTAVFLRDVDRIGGFLSRYHSFWRDAGYSLASGGGEQRFKDNYQSVGPGLAVRFAEIHAAVLRDETDRLGGFRGRWARHCAELRRRVLDLGARGELVFPPRIGGGPPAPITEPGVLLPYLLTPYLHMTNNRLGATQIDEAYLSYLLSRSLESDGTAAG